MMGVGGAAGRRSLRSADAGLGANPRRSACLTKLPRTSLWCAASSAVGPCSSTLAASRTAADSAHRVASSSASDVNTAATEGRVLGILASMEPNRRRT